MYHFNKTLREKNVLDRVEKCRLDEELSLLEKQKKSELRMHMSEAQRIRSRYSRTGVYPDSFSEAAGVRMYETHNPGFCYRRNGSHKIPPSMSSTPVLDFQQLRSLLFTNDELDIEKVLCLHLLSVHETETLAMPKLEHLKDIAQANTPIERLIQRSKKTGREKKGHEILNLLPVYVIDVGQDASCTTLDSITREENEEQLFRDARMASRLIINNKIQEILVSALEALKKSNSEKLEQIVECCQNIIYLKQIFNKQYIQEFLKMMKTFSLLTSCESYILTPKSNKHPTHLDVRTVNGNLESLVLQIRKYILQIPSKKKNEWTSLFELNDEILDDNLASSSSHQLVIYSAISRTTHQKKSSRSIVSSARIGKSEVLDKSSLHLGRRSYRNFTSRNFLPVLGESVTRKVFDVEEWSKRSPPTNFTTNPLPSIASIQESLMETTGEHSLQCPGSKIRGDEEEVLKDIMPNCGSFIKRIGCCACQEKWKCSLPSPKIPNYTRPGLPLQVYEDPFKISHMNRISSKISEELYKLRSYDSKYSVDNVNARIKMSQNSTQSTAQESDISTYAESVEISPYDLARVSHEIADKETDKKLDEFLKQNI